MRQQPFASPEEALAHLMQCDYEKIKTLRRGELAVVDVLVHFGVKGMHWGVRNDKAALAAQSFGQPYSHAVGLGHGSEIFTLKKPENLRVEVRDNIIDVRPKDGFRTKKAERFHDEMVRGVEEMTKEYPALRGMKIEITPMSHQPGGRMMIFSGVPVAATHLKNGEARLFYNDRMRGNPDKFSFEAKNMQPGIQTRDFIGRHEMGHVLAMAGGQLPSGWDTTHRQDFKEMDAEREMINRKHKELFVKHKLSFEELSKLSPYAATEPGEALAEATAYYHTPTLRNQMSPHTQVKVKAMLDDIGGKHR
jgi:hypothetical protein